MVLTKKSPKMENKHEHPIKLSQSETMNAERFYVYEHIRKDTGAVFYVGKGCGDRAFNFTNRGDNWKSVKDVCGEVLVRLPVKNVDEEFSWFAEIELIDLYKKHGINLVNISKGGKGFGSIPKSEEHKRKIALTKIGIKRPIDVVERMKATKRGKLTGIDNPFYGKTHSAETVKRLRLQRIGTVHSEASKEKIRIGGSNSAETLCRMKPVFCITNGTTYKSVTEVVKMLNVHRVSVTNCCNKKSHTAGGYKFEWGTK